MVVQTGSKRDPRLKDVPTLNELMQQYKTPESGKRLAKVVLTAATLGRPISAPPGMPADRTKILRDAYAKAMKDPELLAEAEKRGWDVESVDRRRARIIGERSNRATSRSHRTDEMGAGTVNVIDHTRSLLKKAVKESH